MDAKQFLAEFGHIANAPGGVTRLREMVLALAVQGRLVKQDPSDVPAAAQISEIRNIAKAREAQEKRRKAKASRSAEPTVLNSYSVIPPGWSYAKLSKLVRVLNGRAYSKQELLTFGTPVLRVGNLFTSNHWYYSNLDLEDDKYCDNGDLLYAWSASFGPFIWSGPRVIYHYHIWKLDLFSSELLNKQFLYTYLLEKTQEIKASGHGISMAHMTKDKFEQLDVLLPPLTEQSRIVAKVDELMALCDKLETQQQQRRSLKNNLRQSILQALAASTTPQELQANWTRLANNFGQLFHTPNDLLDLRQCIKRLALGGLLSKQDVGEAISPELKNAAITSSHPVTEADMDWEIPNRWIWARTDWLGEARLGKMLDASKNKGEPLLYLRNINVRWRKFQLTDVLTMRVEPHELPKISVRQGDLVICEGGEPGRAAIWREPRDFVIQKALHRFRCGNDVLPEYMLLCLEHDYFSGRLSRYYTGATIKHLTGRSLSEYAIPLPPIAEQDRIVKRVDELILQCDQLERQLGSALQIADRLAISAIASITGITTEPEEDEPMKAPKTELIAPLRLGTPPSTKEQAPLAAILAHQNGEMAAKDLWQRFGGEIDVFYAQLKLEVDKGWIQEPEMANMRQLETS